MASQASRRRGIALITVLLFFAFLSAIAVRLASNHSMLIAQSQNTFTADLALNYALGGEEMARQALYEDFTHSGKEVDHLQETWAQPLPPLALDEGGVVEIQIQDLHGCFNVNALGGAGSQASHSVLINLLNIVGLPPAIADRALDWVDADDITTGFGAEDNEYLLTRPAFRTPNGRMGDVSEVRVLLDGVDLGDADINRDLLPFLCAHPADVLQVNVNSARGEVLVALLPGTDLGRMQGIANFDPGGRDCCEGTDLGRMQGIANQPRSFRTVGEFVQSYPEYQGVTASLRATSDWFRISVRVQIDRTTVILSSLAWRDPATGRVSIRSRDFGRDFRTRVRTTVEGEEKEAS